MLPSQGFQTCNERDVECACSTSILATSEHSSKAFSASAFASSAYKSTSA